jgi:hypothetical protein
MRIVTDGLKGSNALMLLQRSYGKIQRRYELSPPESASRSDARIIFTEILHNLGISRPRSDLGTSVFFHLDERLPGDTATDDRLATSPDVLTLLVPGLLLGVI